jgi:hypothetical protein
MWQTLFASTALLKKYLGCKPGTKPPEYSRSE